MQSKQAIRRRVDCLEHAFQGRNAKAVRGAKLAQVEAAVIARAATLTVVYLAKGGSRVMDSAYLADCIEEWNGRTTKLRGQPSDSATAKRLAGQLIQAGAKVLDLR